METLNPKNPKLKQEQGARLAAASEAAGVVV